MRERDFCTGKKPPKILVHGENPVQSSHFIQSCSFHEIKSHQYGLTLETKLTYKAASFYFQQNQLNHGFELCRAGESQNTLLQDKTCFQCEAVRAQEIEH